MHGRYDPIEIQSFLRNLDRLIRRADRTYTGETQMAGMLGLRPSQLAGVLDPARIRSLPPSVGRGYVMRIDSLLRMLSGSNRDHRLLAPEETLRYLGRWVTLDRGRFRLKHGAFDVRHSNLVQPEYSEKTLTAVNEFLAQGAIQPLREWETHTRVLLSAFSWTTHRRDDDAIVAVYRTLVSAAHIVNGLCPDNGDQVHGRIFSATEMLAKRLRSRGRQAAILAIANRAIAYKHQAQHRPYEQIVHHIGRACKTFSYALLLARQAEDSACGDELISIRAERLKLQLSRLEAELIRKNRRGGLGRTVSELVATEQELRRLEFLTVPGELGESFSRLKAKFLIRERQYKLALVILHSLEFAHLSPHNQFEHVQLLAIAAAGDSRKESRRYLQYALQIADAAEMKPQRRLALRLLRALDVSPQRMTEISVLRMA